MLRVKGKEKILKLAREKWYVIYKGTLIYRPEVNGIAMLKVCQKKTLKTETKPQSEKSISKN